jgi:RNA polymerase sigma-70 factor (ECF subfamily)
MTISALSVFPFSTILSAHIESARRRWFSAPAAESITIASDAELVTGYLEGDPRAFSELVKRYTAAIYNVTYRFTNDAHEAENLTQETFVRAWNALPRLSLDKPLKAYFVKIAVNLCRDWATRRKIENVLPLEAEGETDIPDESGDPLRMVGEQELVGRIRTKMELLPPLYRTVLTLRYTEEMSYEEMTMALDLPLNTVRTNLHRAKAKLRELLEQDKG